MNRARGIILVELTLILPIFLALLLLFYWFGLVMQGRETVYDSVGQAVHRAKTRGNFLVMGFDPNDASIRGLVETVDDFYDSGSTSFTSRLRDLLSTQDVRDSGVGIESRYREYLTEPCEYREDSSDGSTYQACFYDSAIPFNAFPREAWYSLVYVSNAFKQSLGPLARFPCDPSDNDTSSSPGGSGCIKCRFLPLVELGLAGCDNVGSGCEHLLNSEGAPRDRFGIECYYRFPELFFRPILTLIGLDETVWQDGVRVYAKEWSYRELDAFCIADEAYCNY